MGEKGNIEDPKTSCIATHPRQISDQAQSRSKAQNDRNQREKGHLEEIYAEYISLDHFKKKKSQDSISRFIHHLVDCVRRNAAHCGRDAVICSGLIARVRSITARVRPRMLPDAGEPSFRRRFFPHTRIFKDVRPFSAGSGMTVFQVLPEVVRPVELLRLVAFSELMNVGEMVNPAVPLGLWIIRKFSATVSTRIVRRPVWGLICRSG